MDYNKAYVGLVDLCVAPRYSRFEIVMFEVARHERAILLVALALLAWWVL